MVELMRNSIAMNKLQDEVRSATTGSNGRAMVAEEELRQMPYLEAVIMEVLRLHPPAPVLPPRETLEDCEIQGYSIPRKTMIFVNAWAIARDPKYRDTPKEFQPERFSDGAAGELDTNGHHEFRYVPFGAGRRICPGMNFAMASMKLALANLVRCFNWVSPSGLSREDLHTEEAPGIVTRRQGRLCLVAKPWST